MMLDGTRRDTGGLPPLWAAATAQQKAGSCTYVGDS
jgi:hypothetical protein